MDALDILNGYDDVGGVDYAVGAAPLVRGGLDPKQMQSFMAAQGQANRVAMAQQLMHAGRAALQVQKRVQHERRLRAAALSGAVPMFKIPMSTAAGVTVAGGGALFLAGAPGVPSRPLRYTCNPAFSLFFGLTVISAGRTTMISGGAGTVPASDYNPDSTNSPLDFPKLGAGSPIIVAGANEDAVAHPFRSSFSAVDLTSASDQLR